MTDTVINLQPIVDQIIIPTASAILVPLLGGLGALALKRVSTFFHLKNTTRAGEVIESAIQNGTQLALSKVQTLADAHSQVDVKSEVIAGAYNYAVPKIQAEMKVAGITPASIAERIEARLPAGVATAAYHASATAPPYSIIVPPKGPVT